MNVAFGQRLSEIATDSASMSEPPTKASTQSIPVEEIVYKSKLGYVERLSKATNLFILLPWLRYKRFQKFGRQSVLSNLAVRLRHSRIKLS